MYLLIVESLIQINYISTFIIYLVFKDVALKLKTDNIIYF